MRISDWSSDVCSSDLGPLFACVDAVIEFAGTAVDRQSDHAGGFPVSIWTTRLARPAWRRQGGPATETIGTDLWRAPGLGSIGVFMMRVTVLWRPRLGGGGRVNQRSASHTSPGVSSCGRIFGSPPRT